jgi:hypothetical protein
MRAGCHRWGIPEPASAARGSLSMAISRTDAAPRRSAVLGYLLLQACAGLVLGALAAGALLLADAFGLRRLLAADIVAVAVFILGGITAIAPLVFATAIGLLAEPGETSGRHCKRRP